MTGMNTLMLLYLHTGINNCSTAICYDNNKTNRTSRHNSSKYTPFQLLYKSSTFSQGNRMTITVMIFPCE